MTQLMNEAYRDCRLLSVNVSVARAVRALCDMFLLSIRTHVHKHASTIANKYTHTPHTRKRKQFDKLTVTGGW